MRRNEFIEACRANGARMDAAMRVINHSYTQRLFRECIRAVRSAATAEDLVQETLLKAWKNCRQFRGESEVFGWLLIILRRNVIDHLRSRHPEEPLDDAQGEPRIEVLACIAELSEERIPSPEEALKRAEVADCLARRALAFQRVAPLHATVMQWVAEDSLNNEQVTQLLQRTPGATREFISQARKKARQVYAECHELAFGNSASRS